MLIINVMESPEACSLRLLNIVQVAGRRPGPKAQTGGRPRRAAPRHAHVRG